MHMKSPAESLMYQKCTLHKVKLTFGEKVRGNVCVCMHTLLEKI